MKNAMYNVRAILEASKSKLFNALVVKVYLSDAYYLEKMEELYRFFFPIKDPPTREVIIVSSLPKGALIQVSAIASLGMSF
jgi:enamine deaminase RidA (YjgF/YER057c/UK114 family)